MALLSELLIQKGPLHGFANRLQDAVLEPTLIWRFTVMLMQRSLQFSIVNMGSPKVLDHTPKMEYFADDELEPELFHGRDIKEQ